MEVINQQFNITYQYPVYFTEHLFRQDNKMLGNFFDGFLSSGKDKKCLFVLDAGMLKYHAHLEEEIRNYLKNLSVSLVPFVFLPGGEQVKNDTRFFEEILSAINKYGIDRHASIVAVGGGAVLDLAGYAAAVAHRGIRHIRIPTTVLSQNDSGVGVKNGINYFGKKNFLGAFAPPEAVFNDIHFLTTLDDRNWRSGIAEAVKVALIKDRAFFEWLEQHATDLVNRDMHVMMQLVHRCAELHVNHIASGDPFESGSSRPLDFGHWSAHKMEQLSNFSILHGEAVAVGIALDTLYSCKINWINAAEKERMLSLLQQLKFDIYHPVLEEKDLMLGLDEFREHLGGELTIMLLRNIGKGANVHEMNRELISQCIHELNDRSRDNISARKISIAR